MRAVRRLAVAAILAAVPLAHADSTALDSLVAAERAFAQSSVEEGMKTAFLAALAPDAILFRPGPVNGVQLWTSRPESPAVLEWAPSFAELSGDGDLGFTSGPWSFRPAKGQAPVAFGHFVSVWRRDVGRPWRVALDIGVSHADPGTPPEAATVTPGPAHEAPDSNAWRGPAVEVGVGVRSGGLGVGIGTGGAAVGFGGRGGGVALGFGTAGIRSRQDYVWRRTQHEKNTLMGAERAFAWEARQHGWDAAYRAVAANDLRWYRDGAMPGIGHEAAIAGAATWPRTREWVARGHAVARSWDLGYTYGLAIAKPGRGAPKGARPDTAAFVHLWRKDDGGRWRMMLDVESPFPKPAK